ncbi:fibrinolytic enzyme, isozyme C-like [Phlebotomus papatasi]|uniref:fibrinolytic enzyme, isozyme C-like n=1 Tax=Phlebotomus papatasi TaxID=29031 RepID=UPI00248467D6|nr:fibrinolytic enzyme, isozyme C-like [Phlebotomus papatasi]
MKILLVLANLFLCNSAYNINHHRIIGGVHAIPGEFPHMLSVQMNSSSNHGHYCGASIINDRWSLTAAHCVKPMSIDTGEVVVIAGAWDFNKPSEYQQKVMVDQGIQHPSYKGLGKRVAFHDIGLLHLAKALVWNDWIKPVILPHPNTPVHDEAVFSGWGLIEDTPSGSTNILQRATMRVITVSECYHLLVPLEKTEDLFLGRDICTKPYTEGLSVCIGDSGGPFGEWHGDDFLQLGIAIWTIGTCGEADVPSVFARVSEYLGWIRYYVEGYKY